MIERDSLGYLISTVEGYEGPLQRLLASMPPLAGVAVVTGRSGQRVTNTARTQVYITVPHNSYDYTALIDLIEHPHSYPAWSHVFLLHDTMELGTDSDTLIRQADPALDCVAVWGGECNLCLYRVDYLMRRRDAILALKDCTKLRAVEAEGFLWRSCPEDRRGVYPGTIQIHGAGQIFGGANRQPITYTGVGITKYKANWGQAWPPNVVTP